MLRLGKQFTMRLICAGHLLEDLLARSSLAKFGRGVLFRLVRSGREKTNDNLIPMKPEDIAREEHRDYYAAGGFDEGRLRWTVETFLPGCQGKRILEIGCGDGKLLALLHRTNEVYGIEASTTGVEKCGALGIRERSVSGRQQPAAFPSRRLFRLS